MFIQHCQPAFNFKTAWQEGNKFYYRHSLRYFTSGNVKYVWYTETILNHNPTKRDVEKMELFEINRAKKYIISCIEEAFKKSKKVMINGKMVWFNSEQRSALINAIDSEYNVGKTMTELIIDNEKLNIPIDTARMVITSIEEYSKSNFIKKTDMINEVNALSVLQDIVDYEEKILFNIPINLFI